ncbi:UNVERIFIED_CONTAM: hypothetical protein Slati_3476000, partial [Sesamum latifolium]
ITHEEASIMVAPITDSEIKNALFDISKEKSPGPDGYTSAFFKAARSVVGDDVILAVWELFSNRRLLKELNATLLALVPKVELPTSVTGFRPITCYNVIYKTITEILVQ